MTDLPVTNTRNSPSFNRMPLPIAPKGSQTEPPHVGEKAIADTDAQSLMGNEQFTDTTDTPTLPSPTCSCRAGSTTQSRTNTPWYFPTTIQELLTRHQAVLDLFHSGALSQEVQALGVKPEWLRHYHSQKPFVAIAEQNIPVSSIFHHLGEYGDPTALHRTGQLLAFIRDRLSRAHDTEVDAGLLVSPEDQVTFAGVTNGFFFPMPGFGQLTELASKGIANDSRMENLQLISKSQRAKLESNNQGGIAYHSVDLDVAKVRDVLAWIDKAKKAITPSLNKHKNSFDKQREFYHGQASTFPVEERERLQGQIDATSRRISTCTQLIGSLDLFGEDVRAALESTRVNPSDTKLSFWNLVNNFNTSFCQRLALNFPFKTISNNLVNEFPTTGVENWGKFLGAFARNNVVEPNQCALRWRNDIEGQASRYVSLSVSEIRADDVVLQDRSGNTYSARELQIKSEESMLAGAGPRLIPGASIIYWVNYAVGNSIVLDDGMYYKKIERLARAVRSPEFCENPRDIVIYPYTRLYKYRPPDVSDPYSEIKPRHSTLDFYKSILERNT